MDNCKPVETKSKLGALDRQSVSDNSLYMSLAGALQYLTFTRSDIVYVILQICLFMHDPRELHFNALKRIIRYIRGTMDHGLHLYRSAPTILVSYTDADWGGSLILGVLLLDIMFIRVIIWSLGLQTTGYFVPF
ncbi:uncharacterized protein LOC110714815 [Chenopodium quinoa]|uniref:uncharacterized protein LOC110714815 n=1 Tax=Chenopodium quinoa TaxID=63459 RepID=UPI000B7903E1|nr:uncharacterized protein LOC110714815 [Chenopodium quinoa]